VNFGERQVATEPAGKRDAREFAIGVDTLPNVGIALETWVAPLAFACFAPLCVLCELKYRFRIADKSDMDRVLTLPTLLRPRYYPEDFSAHQVRRDPSDIAMLRCR